MSWQFLEYFHLDDLIFVALCESNNTPNSDLSLKIADNSTSPCLSGPILKMPPCLLGSLVTPTHSTFFFPTAVLVCPYESSSKLVFDYDFLFMHILMKTS